jgi:uncharacterized protein (UPF0261 family)
VVVTRKAIGIIATLDSKGEQAAFIRAIVEKRGHLALSIDTGILGTPAFPAGVSRDAVAAAAGTTVAALATLGDRGKALGIMLEGAATLVCDLQRQGALDGVIGIGGGSGTAVAAGIMRRLPFGFPKLMVSTMAGGDVGRYVGTKDIAMLNSVTDLMGLNPILCRVLANGAGAICGMVEEGSPEPECDASRIGTIGLTAFGVTTPAALRCRELLEAAGYHTMVFHANGTGGRALEELVAQGSLDAVLDLTTTELADELCGGKLSAGPHRLEAAGERGIPQVVLPGAMDMVNFGPPETVPPRFAGRRFYRHNPSTTLMRTTADESATLGKWVGEKLARAKGPAALVLPMKGFSAYDQADGVFDDPAADQAFMTAAASALGDRVPIVRLDCRINDPECAEQAVRLLLEMLQRAHA